MRQAAVPVKMATANGLTTSKNIVTATVGSLGVAVDNVRVLQNSPRVLSVARLVRDLGAKFWWTQGGAVLQMGNRRFELDTEAGVPTLALPACEPI